MSKLTNGSSVLICMITLHLGLTKSTLSGLCCYQLFSQQTLTLETTGQKPLIKYSLRLGSLPTQNQQWAVQSAQLDYFMNVSEAS